MRPTRSGGLASNQLVQLLVLALVCLHVAERPVSGAQLPNRICDKSGCFCVGAHCAQDSDFRTDDYQDIASAASVPVSSNLAQNLATQALLRQGLVAEQAALPLPAPVELIGPASELEFSTLI